MSCKSGLKEEIMSKLKVLIIGGAGKQGRLYNDILSKQRDLVEDIFIFDPKLHDNWNRAWVINKFPNDGKKFDVALITVPHSLHFQMTKQMLEMGKYVIKEKPLACSSKDAQSLINQTVNNRLALFTTTHRPYTFMLKRLKEKLGQSVVHSFNYVYQKDFPRPSQGWRSIYRYCKGGVLLDMGYHIIDLLNRLFGLPVRVTASFGFFFDESKKENLEDTALLNLDYGFSVGTVKISRHDYSKQESFSIVTKNNLIYANKKEITLTDRNERKVTQCIEDDERLVLSRMLRTFLENISNQEFIRSELEINFKNVLLMDALYKSATSHNWIELSDPLKGE